MIGLVGAIGITLAVLLVVLLVASATGNSWASKEALLIAGGFLGVWIGLSIHAFANPPLETQWIVSIGTDIIPGAGAGLIGLGGYNLFLQRKEKKRHILGLQTVLNKIKNIQDTPKLQLKRCRESINAFANGSGDMSEGRDVLAMSYVAGVGVIETEWANPEELDALDQYQGLIQVLEDAPNIVLYDMLKRQENYLVQVCSLQQEAERIILK